MPKIKLTQRQVAEKQIVNNIRSLANKRGMKYDKEISHKVGIPTSTFAQKMKEPRKITFSDLLQISTGLGVPIQEIFTDI